MQPYALHGYKDWKMNRYKESMKRAHAEMKNRAEQAKVAAELDAKYGKGAYYCGWHEPPCECNKPKVCVCQCDCKCK